MTDSNDHGFLYLLEPTLRFPFRLGGYGLQVKEDIQILEFAQRRRTKFVEGVRA